MKANTYRTEKQNGLYKYFCSCDNDLIKNSKTLNEKITNDGGCNLVVKCSCGKIHKLSNI